MTPLADFTQVSATQTSHHGLLTAEHHSPGINHVSTTVLSRGHGLCFLSTPVLRARGTLRACLKWEQEAGDLRRGLAASPAAIILKCHGAVSEEHTQPLLRT